MIILLDSLVWLTNSICSQVDQIGPILACQLGLIGAADYLVQMLLSQLKVLTFSFQNIDKKCHLRKLGEVPV